MSKFLTSVDIRDLGYRPPERVTDYLFAFLRRRRWQVLQDIVYYSSYLEREITVPERFVCDLSSVPRIPIVFLLFGERAIGPSIVHDWLYFAYEWEKVSRRDSDIVFFEAMGTDGEDYIVTTRASMYAGVRAGGFRAWNRWREYQSNYYHLYDKLFFQNKEGSS